VMGVMMFVRTLITIWEDATGVDIMGKN